MRKHPNEERPPEQRRRKSPAKPRQSVPFHPPAMLASSERDGRENPRTRRPTHRTNLAVPPSEKSDGEKCADDAFRRIRRRGRINCTRDPPRCNRCLYIFRKTIRAQRRACRPSPGNPNISNSPLLEISLRAVPLIYMSTASPTRPRLPASLPPSHHAPPLQLSPRSPAPSYLVCSVGAAYPNWLASIGFCAL